MTTQELIDRVERLESRVASWRRRTVVLGLVAVAALAWSTLRTGDRLDALETMVRPADGTLAAQELRLLWGDERDAPNQDRAFLTADRLHLGRYEESGRLLLDAAAATLMYSGEGGSVELTLNGGPHLTLQADGASAELMASREGGPHLTMLGRTSALDMGADFCRLLGRSGAVGMDTRTDERLGIEVRPSGSDDGQRFPR